MNNTKRESILSEDQIELLNERQYTKCVDEWNMTEDASFHFTNGHLAGMREMGLIYEDARAKDAELIQKLVDDLGRAHCIDKPSLAAAADAGFKHSDI
jgi:hypothetical protein